MKLVIQIPCWNEEGSIGKTIESLPRSIKGIDEIEILVIDDGSSDKSLQVAKKAGAHTVVSLHRHQGLAAAFSLGIDIALQHQADILVNTDADMQYPSKYIEQLIQPLISKKADMVIGDRLAQKPPPFPRVKMVLERFGSWIVRCFSGTPVRDAASGFRAFNREVIESLFIHGEFSYTLESLIFAGMKKFRVVNIPITVNQPLRESRLVKSIFHYIFRSMSAMIRAFLMYYPLKFFSWLGAGCLLVAFFLGIRYLMFYLYSEGAGHVQSLILLAVIAGLGFQCFIVGFIGDVIAANRRILEQIRLKQLHSLHAANHTTQWRDNEFEPEDSRVDVGYL